MELFSRGVYRIVLFFIRVYFSCYLDIKEYSALSHNFNISHNSCQTFAYTYKSLHWEFNSVLIQTELFYDRF